MGLMSLLCVGTVAALSPAKAMVIAPAGVGQRVATADCVVVGKVIGFGDKTVSVPAFPGAEEKQAFQIAIIKIETNILGAKGMKEIRVGFVPPNAGGPARGPIGGPLRRMQVTLSLNQEACLFLTKHPEADFYTAPAYFSVINKKGNADFNKDVNEAKHAAKLLADPKAGLEAKNKADRLLTASLLISHYRQLRPTSGEPKTEPIDAELSKKILRTLADADWTPPRPAPGRPVMLQMGPQNLFFQLGVTEKDGWKQPKDFKQFPQAAKKWLKENADKYRIQRFVYETKTKEKSDR
jgi:hypothetical protein